MHKILIVEQEPILLAIIQKRLEAEGWETAGCADGKMARDLIVSFQPNLLITNLLIPFYSGKEVMVYALEKIKNIYIIIIGLFQQNEAKASLLEMGAKKYFSKPFDIEELINHIQLQEDITKH